MNETITSLDPSILRLIIIMSFSLISIMATAIVVLYNTNQRRSQETFSLLQKSVANLETLNASMITRIELIENASKMDDQNCKVHKQNTNDRFNAHSKRIKDVEVKVSDHHAEIEVIKNKIVKL